MKTPTIVLILVVVATSAIALSQSRQNSTSDIRVIHRPQGVSIRSLLRPSDETVVITEGIAGPPLEIAFSSGEARAQFELESLSRRENALLTVRVESATSSLNAAETWITSTVRLTILDILSPGQSALDGKWGDVEIDTKSDAMLLRVDGGELRLGTTLVSAGDFAVWEPSRTYVVSLRVVPLEKAVHIGVVYEVGSDQKLLPQKRSRGSAMPSPTGLKGRDLTALRKSIVQH